MTKEELIKDIRTSFKDVKLEDGVGIWEGQGLDDYADKETLLKLKERDERENWDSIPYKDLAVCSSSLSFFDAKGMRFCLPKFLIFDILSEQIYKEQGIGAPEVVFTLGYKLNDDYQKNRFSLFNGEQIQCIIHFLEYKIEEIRANDKDYSTNYDHLELTKALNEWKHASF